MTPKTKFVVTTILLPFLIPPVVFALTAVMSGMSLVDSGVALLEQFGARRQNLIMIGVFGLFPILLLHAALWLYGRGGGDAVTRTWLANAGLVAIGLVLVWTNLQYWPRFLPSRTFLSFPHGLEFIIGPGMFAPIAMAATMAAVWIVRRVRADV